MLNQHSKRKIVDMMQPIINSRINANLYQITEHLPVLNYLSSQIKMLKTTLDQSLTEESLGDVIESLTQLITEAFNAEQNRLKIFLHGFADHLRDFSNYSRLLQDDQNQVRQETAQLEKDVEFNILEIKSYMDSARTIEELSSKVGTHLASIEEGIKNYSENAEKKRTEYERCLMLLQDKLMETERAAEEIKNMLSLDKLRSNQDSLTGLPNRKSYDEHIVEAYQRWKRGFGELSLAIADVDGLKSINDNYGCLAGDMILKEIAGLFRSSVRAVDFIARYSGQEFVFIFEHTGLNDAVKVTEGLRSAIEEYSFYYQETKINVTVSFGLSSFQHGDSLETLFMRADQAVREAKSHGRNCVVALNTNPF
ncbi:MULTISPECIES: GGDEF domain-containing protein [unclassified Legionella]|uniref:GGDEF domain-containing protein n=1 Tax=unclassified Legionella TaxID=2622702 RepID=UPI0010569867|nr:MULTISPECIES: GGDEF domain-containing protein [unclassified Legionella]MDI9817736.1 GGDEF domain-containing protein [Legionella sp. PL877]